MTTVQRWSGAEVRALREAKRMSLREFAAHLGVSERMVSKWEKGREGIHPRPVNQAALDTSLSRSDPDTRARFAHLAADSLVPGSGQSSQVELIGSSEIRHEFDGSPMLRVEGSIFMCGPTGAPIWLPEYFIDTYPVSNDDYERFVVATGRPAPRHWVNGCRPTAMRDHPVTFVTWYDANEYARWVGKQLPTAQQWEKAARGTRGTVYPWGDQPTPAKCNVRENGVGGTTPGTCYQTGISPYGVYDLCGNVWEWCSAESAPGRFELKGGAWTSPLSRAAPSNFNDAAATMCDDDTGFRCVLAVKI